MTTLKCCFEDNLDIPCGVDVPSENDHSKKGKASFLEFITHGLCPSHAAQMEASTMDPNILKYLFTSGEFDAPLKR
jgi:hypothetical protein